MEPGTKSAIITAIIAAIAAILGSLITRKTLTPAEKLDDAAKLREQMQAYAKEMQDRTDELWDEQKKINRRLDRWKTSYFAVVRTYNTMIYRYQKETFECDEDKRAQGITPAPREPLPDLPMPPEDE